MNDSSDNEYYSKFKKDEMIIKQKRKASSKKYRENKKMKKNIPNMPVKDKNVLSLHENARVEQIDDYLNKSVASIVSNESGNEHLQVKSIMIVTGVVTQVFLIKQMIIVILMILYCHFTKIQQLR